MESINTHKNVVDIVSLKKAEFAEKCSKYKKEHADIKRKIDASRNKINWHEKHIKRLQNKSHALNHPSWTNEYLRPILEELATQTPDIIWDFKYLNVFGLRCECPVFGRNSENILAGITFTHHEDQLFYDTGETTRNYAPGTLGALNGFNKISAPVDSIETLLVYVRKVLESEKQQLNASVNEENVTTPGD